MESDKEKKKRGDQFLKDLRMIIDGALSEERGIDPAEFIINRLIALWGGQQIYVLKDTSKREAIKKRNQSIYRQFNGNNRHAICQEFGLSEVQFYSIIRRIHDDTQTDLFPK